MDIQLVEGATNVLKRAALALCEPVRKGNLKKLYAIPESFAAICDENRI
jgi:hypothetical protein